MSNSLPQGWEEKELSEFINFNPRESIKKGTLAKSIPMACLTEFSKSITEYEEKEFKGGTKFRNGDTLLARITPCLENGKTAFVDFLDENEVAFGSTEYIVLREKEKVSNKDFIYYLSISPQFREIAIKSMTGSSGRQRVQNDVLFREKFVLPQDINEQKRIADILSAFDDKIELNNQMNKTLEDMATALFKEWFENFNFPNDEGKAYKENGGKFKASELGEIPIDWEVKKFDELFEISSSKRVFRDDYVDKGVPFYRSKEVILKSNGQDIIDCLYISNEKFREIQNKYDTPKKGEILLTSVGTLGIPYLIQDEKFYFKDGNLTWFKNFKYENVNLYIYLWIKYCGGKKALDEIVIGSTQKALTITALKNIKIVFSPEIVNRFVEITATFMNKIQQNQQQNQTLKKQRDTLLPKLMRGKIRV